MDKYIQKIQNLSFSEIHIETMETIFQQNNNDETLKEEYSKKTSDFFPKI